MKSAKEAVLCFVSCILILATIAFLTKDAGEFQTRLNSRDPAPRYDNFLQNPYTWTKAHFANPTERWFTNDLGKCCWLLKESKIKDKTFWTVLETKPKPVPKPVRALLCVTEIPDNDIYEAYVNMETILTDAKALGVESQSNALESAIAISEASRELYRYCERHQRYAGAQSLKTFVHFIERIHHEALLQLVLFKVYWTGVSANPSIDTATSVVKTRRDALKEVRRNLIPSLPDRTKKVYTIMENSNDS